MNCARARCRRAIGPRMRAKRAPESLAAVSKSSQPCRSPRATWSFTSKSKVFGVPQRRTSTLASSSAPTGTDSCGRLGMPSSMASSSPWMASSWRLPSSSSEPMRSTSASSGAMSSPRCLAWPIALERALRSACSCSVRVCTDLRCSSSASMRATSSWKPRVARRAATSCGWVRTSLGSSMLFSRLVSVIGGSWPGWRFAGPGDVIDAVAEAWLAPPSPYRSGFSALAGTGAIQLGQVFQLVADLQFQALDTG